MSRTDWMQECDDYSQEGLLAMGRWWGRRNMVLNGKPALEALTKFKEILENMQHKELITDSLCDGTGVCAMGAWVYGDWISKGINPKDAWKKLQQINKEETRTYRYWENGSEEEWHRTNKTGSEELGITITLAEIVSETNDNGYYKETPAQRYQRMVIWTNGMLNRMKASQTGNKYSRIRW